MSSGEGVIAVFSLSLPACAGFGRRGFKIIRSLASPETRDTHPRVSALAWPQNETNGDTVLEVRGLSIAFASPTGFTPVTREVSFSIAPGERLGVVGESGCGKSVTGLSILGCCRAATAA